MVIKIKERKSMELPPLINTMSKQQLVNVFVETRKGGLDEKQFDERVTKVFQYIYDCGREMGMTEALNYVENSADRERLFSGIDELREEIDNGE